MLDIYTLLILIAAIVGFLVAGNAIASQAIRKRRAAGETLSQIKEEFRRSLHHLWCGVFIL